MFESTDIFSLRKQTKYVFSTKANHKIYQIVWYRSIVDRYRYKVDWYRWCVTDTDIRLRWSQWDVIATRISILLPSHYPSVCFKLPSHYPSVCFNRMFINLFVCSPGCENTVLCIITRRNNSAIQQSLYIKLCVRVCSSSANKPQLKNICDSYRLVLEICYCPRSAQTPSAT